MPLDSSYIVTAHHLGKLTQKCCQSTGVEKVAPDWGQGQGSTENPALTGMGWQLCDLGPACSLYPEISVSA